MASTNHRVSLDAADKSLIRKPFQALRFEGSSKAPAEAVYELLAAGRWESVPAVGGVG